MSNELVTVEELEKQIWEIEGVKVEIKPRECNKIGNRMVRSYNYERLPDDAVVDDLKRRINKCLEPFIYYMDNN